MAATGPTAGTATRRAQAPAATVAERRVPGVVVLGGDVHAHHVADLKADFDDPRAPVLASEFCGTSISSRGRDQKLLDAALPLNPHMLHARRPRGYVVFDIDARQLQARLLDVERSRRPGQRRARAGALRGRPAGPAPGPLKRIAAAGVRHCTGRRRYCAACRQPAQ
jgi:phosphodiesterase/alkaline phosphatase D-like protein